MASRASNSVDGFAVDDHQVRVSGRVSVRNDDAGLMPLGSEVLLVMLGRVAAPTFTENKDGDVIRVGVVKPVEAHVVPTVAARRKIMESLNFDHEAQLILTEADDGGDEPEPQITLVNVTRGLKDVLPTVEFGDIPERWEDVGDAAAAIVVEGEPEPVEDEPPVEDEVDDTPVDDAPIEEDFVVEGESEPAPVEELPPVDDVEEDEAEYLRRIFEETSVDDLVAAAAALDELDPDDIPEDGVKRVKIGGAETRDPRLAAFLED